MKTNEFNEIQKVPPLPGIPGNKKPGEKLPDSPNKFLFPNSDDNTEANSLNELARKVNLLRSLINEYNALTEREKTQVHTVHDYLVRKIEHVKFDKLIMSLQRHSIYFSFSTV